MTGSEAGIRNAAKACGVRFGALRQAVVVRAPDRLPVADAARDAVRAQ